jgi:hypothetical protein
MKFDPGRILATPGALVAFEASGEEPLAFLLRHINLDPGDLSPEDIQENQRSVENGWRILSAYRLSDGTRIWVVTESDRSATTFLLPEEY